MNCRVALFGAIVIGLFGSATCATRAALLARGVDSNITFIHGGPTTRQNVTVEVNGAFNNSVDASQLTASAAIDRSLEFRHEYRYGVPGSDFPGLIRVESDFDGDELIVRVIPNSNTAFPSTAIELDFSGLAFSNSGAIGEHVISDIQLRSFSSSTAVFDQFPFTVDSDFSRNGIVVNLRDVRLIGGTTTAVFGIVTSQVPEPSTTVLIVGAMLHRPLRGKRFI